MKSRMMALCFVVALAALVVGSPSIFAAAVPGGGGAAAPDDPIGPGGDESACVWAQIVVQPYGGACDGDYTGHYRSGRFASTCSQAIAYLSQQAANHGETVCSSTCHGTSLGCLSS